MIGISEDKVIDHGPALIMKCEFCEKFAQMRLVGLQKHITFFWIPVFLTEDKGVLACVTCGKQMPLPKPLFEKLRQAAETRRTDAPAPAGGQAAKVAPALQQEAMSELKAFMKDVTAERGKGILCPYCKEIAHAQDGGLWVDKYCVKCGKELPAQLVIKIATAFRRR
jgi:ribosomal protein L37AE/L43A